MSAITFGEKTSSLRRVSKGFTIIEILIAIAIISILAAIAIPAYNEYIIRSRLTEAYTSLSSAYSSAEQFWSNASPHTYVGFNAANSWPQDTTNFAYTLSNQNVSTFTVTATGRAGTVVAGFVFTINQDGARQTLSVKPGWNGTGAACWVYKRSGDCLQ